MNEAAQVFLICTTSAILFMVIFVIQFMVLQSRDETRKQREFDKYLKTTPWHERWNDMRITWEDGSQTTTNNRNFSPERWHQIKQIEELDQ